MSDTHTDLVIQISTSSLGPSAATPAAASAADSKLIGELRQCLQPGVEIALVFGSCMAITSILWLADPQDDGSVRAGVRLLGLSALRSDSVALPGWNEIPPASVPECVDLQKRRRHV